ncbi:11975_t:CDS:2 [Rhizophagus irregularis]|nr:11975_t:CDS:2 [Rhizophagus irregularis]
MPDRRAGHKVRRTLPEFAKEGLPLSGCSPMAIVIQRNGVNNRWKNNKQHYMNPNTP